MAFFPLCFSFLSFNYSETNSIVFVSIPVASIVILILPFLSVVLEPTEMSLGMEMQLSATQSIFKYTLPNNYEFFKKLYEAGYAKRIEMPVNWCEELGTVLSNDEVIDGEIRKTIFQIQ